MKKKTRRISKAEISAESARKEKLKEFKEGKIAKNQLRFSDQHSYHFWKKKYAEITRWMKKNGIENPYKSRREFISDYNAIAEENRISGETRSRPMDEIKYSLRYKTDYKTALGELKFAREHRKNISSKIEEIRMGRESSGVYEETEEEMALKEQLKETKLSLKSFKEMSTRDFAEKFKDVIKDRYNDLRKQNKSSKQAAEIISNEMFGSP
jgi:hypothetical protein